MLDKIVKALRESSKPLDVNEIVEKLGFPRELDVIKILNRRSRASGIKTVIDYSSSIPGPSYTV